MTVIEERFYSTMMSCMKDISKSLEYISDNLRRIDERLENFEMTLDSTIYDGRISVKVDEP